MNSGKGRASFQFWLQLGLIVLPLLVLGGVGVYFLRQDKHLVEQEAREKARQLGTELAGAAWNVITNITADLPGKPGSQGFRFEIRADGRLLQPSPVLEPVDPSSEEARKAIDLWQKALNLAQSGEITNAVAALREVAHICSQERNAVVLASGLFLGHAAALKQFELELENNLISSEEIERKSGYLGLLFAHFPAPNSSFSFTRATELLRGHETALRALMHWREKWEREEVARSVYESARFFVSALLHETNLVHSPPILFPHQGNLWWSVMHRNADGGTLAVYSHPRANLSQALQLQASSLNAPAYLSFQIGSGVSMLGPPGSTRSHQLLASIQSPLPVQVYLSDPQALFRHQRQRGLWFSAVIGISSLLAIAGAANAFLSLRKQQHLNELKSNFVSSVSHELRAPLASMRLLSEGLQSGRVTSEEKQREYFSYLVQECRRLSVLVENVLDFSRIEQNRKTYTFEEIELCSLLSQCVHILKPAASEQGVELKLNFPLEEKFLVRADPHALQQAVLNLLDNALKHSRAGQSVVLSASSSDLQVRISITDLGPGIPRAEHEKIFERFYRLGSELRRETPGVGIGLSIVKHIVEAHRGTIQVESAPGQGSTFTIVLPRS